MQNSEKPQFLAVLNGLASVKPGAKLTPESLDVWWSSFKDWTIEEFRSAAAHLAKSQEFFPNPFHFEQLRKAGKPTSGEAFSKVMGIARTMSFYSEPTSGDPAIDSAVAACGGYRAFAMCESSKLGFMERRFCDHFDGISDREEIRQALPSVSGTFGLAHALKSLTSREETR